jgi:hypothetical protein
MSGLKQTFVTKLTDVNTVAQEPLGTLRFEGIKVYKYVEFKNTTATVAGAAGTMVAYNAATGHLNNKVVADLTDADAIPIPAGTTLATVTGTLATSYYCWIQIRGDSTLDTAVTSGAVGKGFTLTTTDRTCTVAVAGDVSPYAGISLDGTTGVILNCLY